MNETEPLNDEISLIDLFAVILRYKLMILLITLIAAIGVIAFSVVSLRLPPETSYLPNVYTPTALMLINNSASSGGSMSAALNASGLGSLASLAGLNVPSGSTFSDLGIYLVGTNTFLDTVVDKFDLITKMNKNSKKPVESPRATSRKALKKILLAEYDATSGVFSISFTDKDPVFAQQVVNYCVDYLGNWYNELGVDKNKLQKENLEKNIESTFADIQNLEREYYQLAQGMQGRVSVNMLEFQMEQHRIEMELAARQEVYAQLKVQYELLRVTMDSESPVFQILEMAEIPDQKSGPGRGLLCIIVTAGAGFFAVFLAFVLNAIENIRKDPEAMAKLRGKKEKEEIDKIA
ncbi:hypothetical protein FACS1894151_01760 [Spirochaetia bacterium]|nr:hypothetical protein FACS1894151_01760 [Spirochaetia bacterium]